MFGPLIRGLRRRRARSLRELARAAGVSKTHLSDLECARRPPPPLRSGLYDRLALELGAGADELRAAGRADRSPMLEGVTWRQRTVLL